MTDKTIGTTDSLMKDSVNEDAFLKEIKSDAFFDTELKPLAKIYNEQLENLIRLRVDNEILNYIIMSNPNDRKALDDKAKTIASLRTKRKLIAIIRKEIVFLKAICN